MLEGTELPPEVQFFAFRFLVIPLFNRAPEGFPNARARRPGPALEIGFNVWKVKTSVNWGIKTGEVSGKVQL